MDSLNKHAAEIGSDKKIICSFGSEKTKTVTPAEKEANVCDKCGKAATHLSNYLAREKLLCDEHAEVFRRKNGGLPQDLWFCKPMDKKENLAKKDITEKATTNEH